MKKMTAILIVSLLHLTACTHTNAATENTGRNDAAVVTAVSHDYEMTVAGEKEPVFQFKHYHYSAFDLTASVDVTLTPATVVSTFDISPHSRGIVGSLEGNTIRFTLDKPGYVMVRVNDTEKFFIFADKPVSKPEKGHVSVLSYDVDNDGRCNVTKEVQKAINETARKKQTLVFPAGIYTCGQLTLPSNAHIHLERGAMLQTDMTSAEPYKSTDDVKTKRFLYIKKADNVKITGRGAINGNGAQLREDFGDDARMRLILAVDSRNLLIEGVMLQDPGSWNTQILKCRDVVIRNVKLMNDVETSNTDGFDPDATQHMLIEDCFAYCSDDNVAIKTTNYSGYLQDVDDITVRGCVFLTKKSSLKVGTETRGNVMKNITFENNDVLESDRGMALYISDGAAFENIRYINNRFERNHPDAKRCGIHFVVNLRNQKAKLGVMREILVKDCTFEEAFPKRSEVKYPASGNGIEVTIENLVIAGKKVSNVQDAGISVQNSTVTFK